MVEIKNIVASGDIGQEIDLLTLSTDIRAEGKQYTPENFPGLIIRIQEDSPTILLFSSGAYSITGATTKDQVTQLFRELVNRLEELGIDVDSEQTSPTIKNMVCKGHLGREIKLEALTVELGVENVEYEPEQSPFLYYWPPNHDCLMTIPTNGEVIITGVQEKEQANEVFKEFTEFIESLFDDTNNTS